MQAKDIMTTTVVTVSPDTTVSAIAKKLIESRVSAVPVVDGDGWVVGIVSEGDLMRRPETGTEPHHSWWLRLIETPEEHASEYVKSHGLCADDVMTRDVITVAQDTPVGEIAQLLEERKIKRVPVVENDKLVGMVSRANLLHGLATPATSRNREIVEDDRTIRAAIISELEQGVSARMEFINLTVTNGVVHVWGIAESPEERKAIRVAIENAPGVRNVEDHMGVLSPNTRALMWAE